MPWEGGKASSRDYGVSRAAWKRTLLKFLPWLGLGAAAFVLLTGALSYTLLSGLIESRLAANLRESYGLEEEPAVEVSSNFPPELLLGRIDRVEIEMDSFVEDGIRLRDLRVDLKDVDAAVSGLLGSGLRYEVRTGSLIARMPEEAINAYLRENVLGLERGRIDVSRTGVSYRTSDLLGLAASVGLDLRVAGPQTIEVMPETVRVGGLTLPPFLTEPLASEGQALNVGDLPLGAGLVGIEPGDDALVIRAELGRE